MDIDVKDVDSISVKTATQGETTWTDISIYGEGDKRLANITLWARNGLNIQLLLGDEE